MRRSALALLLLTAVAGALILWARPAAQANPDTTFTVNSTADPGDGTCDATECTLREAIAAANASAGTDTIEFNIAGAGPHTISPGSALPTITDPVIIDGTTEPDFAGTPVIELDGSGAGDDVDGLKITAGSSTVRALVINGFDGQGIELSGSGGNTLQGNYIGTNVAGTADMANGTGVRISFIMNNTIGGSAVGEGNVISGNVSDAMWMSGASSNVVIGNYIGTDATGSYAIGNGNGVDINETAQNNTVGGAGEGERNVISGNTFSGVAIGDGTSGNVVKGNYIGTDATGHNGIGNGMGVCIWANAANSTIGGTGAGEGNVIAYNTLDGVQVQLFAIGNTIRGNSIHSNGDKGIELVDGGNTELAAPVIDGLGGSVHGHTSPKCYPCTVEVFSDNEDEGRIYHGYTTTNNDATGTWTYPGTAGGRNVTATITDSAGNTSEFSDPFPFPVGGIAELPGASDSATRNYIGLGALAAAALLALAAGGWYAGRRWLR
ncbi:MAG: hypothetical protein AMJ77_02510 [Dehalococcoidia bacterium SM23_28_2]|nr:MAG: hypothetical protein AMJ77_02510 [Dehalococcoidia bacterium SM23_28_2]